MYYMYSKKRCKNVDMLKFYAHQYISMLSNILDITLGLLTIQQTLDRETTPSYTLTVQVQDQGTPQRSAIKQISIHVLDINDHAPAFSQATYTVSITENSAPRQNVLQLSATDSDIGKQQNFLNINFATYYIILVSQ